MEDTIYIYGLVDPRNGDVRYVGKTNDIAARYKTHVSEASTYIDHCTNMNRPIWNTHQRPKILWMSYVFKVTGSFPDIVVLDTAPVSEWEQAEIRWIRKLLNEGKRLTNAASGGASSRGWRRAKERALAVLYDEFGQAEVGEYRKSERSREPKPCNQSSDKQGLRESRIVWTNPLMLVSEVAERLSVTDNGVVLLIREGKLPAYKFGGWRVKTEDVDRYLQENQVTPEDEG